MVLDSSKGIIPKGYDLGQITVSAEGASGDASIAFRCEYLKPTVQITNPPNDTTIAVSATNLPKIVLEETHTPGPGQKFEPVINWDPAPVIDTKDYFEQMQDTLELVVKVTAENDGGSAADTRRIRLVKKGCEGPPCIGVTEFDVTPIQWDNNPECDAKKSALGATKDRRPPNVSLVPCLDRASEQWKLEISRVAMTIYYGACLDNKRSSEWVYSLNDITSKEKACQVKNAFEWQIVHLEASVEMGDPKWPIPLTSYSSYEAVLLHEKLHAANLASHVGDAYEKLKGDLGSLSVSQDVTCDPAEVARRLKADKLRTDFEVAYSQIRKGEFNDNEVQSRKIQLAFLRAQAEELERNFGKCSE